MYIDLYYEQAIKHYEQAVKKNDGNKLLKLKLGNSNYLLGKYAEAAKWYGEVLDNDPPPTSPLYKLYYAESLLGSGQLEKAKEWYQAYQSQSPDSKRGTARITGIEHWGIFARDSAIAEISPLPFNTEYAEIAATPFGDGILFSSTRGKPGFIDHDYLREEDLYDIYEAGNNGGTWAEPKPFDKVINSKFHEGPLTLFPAGNKMMITRTNQRDNKPVVSADGTTKLQIYTVEKTGDLWANVQAASINNVRYSVAHPALNATGDTLYFASNMPDGYGGVDIYMTTLSDGQWSPPENLGDIINTQGDELYPYFGNGRLFFASNGHAGMGGLDIYKAIMRNGRVVGVANLGSPINTHQDDFALSIAIGGRNGFITSNRDGGLGKDDLYSFTFNQMPVEGIAIQAQDQSPIGGVDILVKRDGQILGQALTDADGRFHLQVPFDTNLQIEASKEGHDVNANYQFSTAAKRFDLDTLVIELRKQDLFANGKIYDNETEQLMRNVLVVLENLTNGERDSLLTARDGQYKFPIKPGYRYQITASKNQFIASGAEFTSENIEKGSITNDIVLEEVFIDKEEIRFDFNKTNLRTDTRPALNRILALMKKYPDYFLIIGAHADARGTKEYNQELSDNRAQTVLRFFTSRGVRNSQIIARGFGESLVLNRCSDGNTCEEVEHSRNRRAELKVEKELPEEELEGRN